MKKPLLILLACITFVLAGCSRDTYIIREGCVMQTCGCWFENTTLGKGGYMISGNFNGCPRTGRFVKIK